MILTFVCNGLTRRLQKVENAVVAVRQDNSVDTIRIAMRQEEFNNIDLSEVSVKMLYVDEEGTTKAYQTGTAPVEGVYYADWELTSDVVDAEGNVTFAVKLAIVENGDVVKEWFSIPETFRVYDSLDDSNNPPGETESEQATNAEKIAQIQSQLGTATDELSSLTDTVSLHGAALDTLNSNTCRLMGITVIAANTDMNTLTTIGEYALTVAENASTLQNKPSDLNTAFRMRAELMTAGNYNYIRQTIFVYSSDVVYTRYTTDGGSAWSDWVKQPTMAAVQTMLDSLMTKESLQIRTADYTYTLKGTNNSVYLVFTIPRGNYSSQFFICTRYDSSRMHVDKVYESPDVSGNFKITISIADGDFVIGREQPSSAYVNAVVLKIPLIA